MAPAGGQRGTVTRPQQMDSGPRLTDGWSTPVTARRKLKTANKENNLVRRRLAGTSEEIGIFVSVILFHLYPMFLY